MRRHQNLLLLLIVILLAVVPLWLARKPEAGALFSGADGQARDAITTLAPGYKPWAAPLMTPPSGEVEGLLFALQAALGAGFIGFYFGVRHARRACERKEKDAERC